jgi:hypothetical protein
MKAVFLTVDLFKKNPKQIVTGTKIVVYNGDTTQYQEFSPTRGFQSSMYTPTQIGLNGRDRVDSVRIIWPDNKMQVVRNVSSHAVLTPVYDDARDLYSYPSLPKPLFRATEIREWKHTPAETNDFKRQFMLPRMYSFSGPKMITGDVNRDGLMDFYSCGPKHQPGALFIQQRDGSFTIKKSDAFEADEDHQDEDASFFDADKDGDLDLYVVSGGYDFGENDPLLQDRLYLNDGLGTFRKAVNAVPSESFAGSCVSAFDVDGDQDLDLFVGSRLVPGHYPATPQSMLLINDGRGHFINEIKQRAPALENGGMVCGAHSMDLNKDGKPDLVVVGEWMPVKIMINRDGVLTDETEKWFSTSTKGWWNCVIAEDFDKDGDQDLIVGNAGLNNQYKVSPDHPATLVYKDFNNDGQMDAFFCYFINGQSFPYASRDEALGQVSFLKQRFPDYTSYANATLETIFTKDELKGATTLRADLLKTVYLENKGDRFEIGNLPIQAQFSSVYAIASYDVDRDGDLDVVMGGNESNVRVRIGKTDANRGFVFLNDGKGHFTYVPQSMSGLNLSGDVRQLLFISSKDQTRLLVGQTGKAIISYMLK